MHVHSFRTALSTVHSSSSEQQQQQDKRALFIQLMWFSAILASIASLVTAGIGLQNYLNTTGVPDFAAFLNSESGLDNVNVDLSLFATLILAILLNLAALMAE